MDEPICAQKGSYKVQLAPGDYYWCACGRSKSQPFCDGSHKGTGHTPLKFSLAEAKPVSLCGCKRTMNRPYCDGTHRTF